MKFKVILLFVIVLCLGVIVFVILKTSDKTKTQLRQENKNTVLYQPQTDEKGAVRVEVVPLSLARGKSVSFTITLATHSGNPIYDIVTTSKLTDDKGNTYKALSWTGGKEGHHVLGTLTFPKLSEQVSSVTLLIPKIDGQDRVFIWDLR